MKKKRRVLILLPMILCILCSGYYLVESYSTIGGHPIDNLDDLLITQADFPPGWQMKYKRTDTDEFDYGERNRIIAFSGTPSGFAYQYVFKFKNVLAAARGYRLLGRRLFYIQEEEQEDFLNYESRLADAMRLECGVVAETGVRICDFLGRYDDLVVYFGIYSKAGQFTPEQLERILESINRRVETVLVK